MNRHLDHLITLAAIDKEVDSFEPRIQAINKELTAILEQKSELARAQERLSDEIRDCELNRQKNEAHLADLSKKMEEIGKKNKLIKTEKEMKALQLEEEIAKEQIHFANEEIERLEKAKEIKSEKISELQVKMDELQSHAKTVEENSRDQMDALEQERQKVFTKKEKLMGEMDQKIIGFYEKIRRWAGNTTVVPVKKQACYGCFMRLNDKTYAQVIKGDDIITCPHCGRILFLAKEEEVILEPKEADASV